MKKLIADKVAGRRGGLTTIGHSVQGDQPRRLTELLDEFSGERT